MPAYIRAIVSMFDSTDPGMDKISNTLYFKNQDPFDSTNFQQLAQDIGGAFATSLPDFPCGVDKINTKTYSMEDAEPRLPRGQATETVGKVAAGNREVALCLSYRGEENRPRQRGRAYIGPFGDTQVGRTRPELTLRSAVLALADKLAGIGGINIDWCVYSPTTYTQTQNYGEAFKPVQYAWVDDAWDVQRSRGLSPSTRTGKAFSE